MYGDDEPREPDAETREVNADRANWVTCPIFTVGINGRRRGKVVVKTAVFVVDDNEERGFAKLLILPDGVESVADEDFALLDVVIGMLIAGGEESVIGGIFPVGVASSMNCRWGAYCSCRRTENRRRERSICLILEALNVMAMSNRGRRARIDIIFAEQFVNCFGHASQLMPMSTRPMEVERERRRDWETSTGYGREQRSQTAN